MSAPVVRRRGPRLLPRISGVVAGGVVMLTAAVLGAWLIGRVRGFPGPSATLIWGHLAAAVVAVAVQRYADRRAGAWAALGALAVLAVAAAVLWFEWFR
jgi:hypothetical protein